MKSRAGMQLEETFEEPLNWVYEVRKAWGGSKIGARVSTKAGVSTPSQGNSVDSPPC